MCKHPCENTLENTKCLTFLRKDPTFQESSFTTCYLLVAQKSLKSFPPLNHSFFFFKGVVDNLLSGLGFLRCAL